MGVSSRAVSAGAMVVLMAACSTLPAVNRTAPELQGLWSERQRDLSQIHSWNISGRLGIQTETEGWHISFRWQQDDMLYHIVMSGPLGQAAAELQGTPQGVTLLRSDGKSATAQDPERLLAQQLGWRVPINGLYYWVRGLPMPATAETHVLDGEGRLYTLDQSGWHIAYRRYGEFSGKALPTKIFLGNDELKVRLVIDEWTVS